MPTSRKTTSAKSADSIKVKKGDVTTKGRKAHQVKKDTSKPRRVVKKASAMEVATLKAQLADTTQKYGELLAQVANLQIQKERMLSKFLLGLYAIGIGPNEILAMCRKMFQPVENK